MNEVWKDIKGYEGYYQVSNLGRVKSLSRTYFSGNGHKTKKTINEYVMRPRATKTGYLRTSLTKNGKTKDVYIHRLVGEYFVDNPYEYKEINHIDEDKSNNVYSNLEWCTRKYNCNYGNRNKLLSIRVKEYHEGKE